ncbi:MAG: NADH-quinone oxidoreductase subunit A [Thermodesulfobacteriota bacterium]
MLLPYFSILVIMGMVTVMGGVALFVNMILGPKNRYADKTSPWECGMPPVGADADCGQFKVHFFLIAILFIVFDVETLFLFPWATLISDKSLSVFIFVEMIIFLLVLTIGLIYAWAKGALEWF